jgi:hypothetical protein
MSRIKVNRKDWRNLPLSEWNTLTVHAMFIELNAEKFGVEEYVPMRNWAFEQAQIKRNLTQYGAEILREVFDECFAEYRPTAQYPQLTAGFVLSFMASRIIPKILANRQRKELAEKARELSDTNAPSESDVLAWL